MSSLRHRGGDRWTVYVSVGKDPATGNYRYRTRSFHAGGIRAAKRKAAPLIAELEHERDRIRAERGTVKQLLDDWMRDRRRELSPATLISYTAWADTIRDRFGSTRVDRLTVREIREWYNHLVDSDTLKPSSVQALHRVFRAALEWGYETGEFPIPATRKVRPPKHDTRKMHPPTLEALAGLIARLPATDWARAARLAAFTGMRRGEVLGLQWADIDPDRNELHIRRTVVDSPDGIVVKQPKTMSGARTVALNRNAAAVLLEQHAATGAGVWVFGDRDGPRRPQWLTHAWSKWCRTNGYRVRFHDLRHFYATEALARGAPLPSVSAQLGHADTSITARIYASATDEGRRQVADSLDAAFPALEMPETPSA